MKHKCGIKKLSKLHIAYFTLTKELSSCSDKSNRLRRIVPIHCFGKVFCIIIWGLLFFKYVHVDVVSDCTIFPPGIYMHTREEALMGI